MDTRRILIVEDDPDMCFLVAHGVRSANANYQVETAMGATEALAQVDTATFDLIVTDYMMPGKSGLELIKEVREVSPQTNFVLMTAHHDTNRVRNMIEEMDIAFLGKPFMVPELLEVVQQSLENKRDDELEALAAPPADDELPLKIIDRELVALLRQTGALSVVLVDTNGEPLHTVGYNQPKRISKLANFVAGNFLGINEVVALFGAGDTSIRTSYYEGQKLNIYTLNLSNKYFIAVLFEPSIKPGTVWFYSKQTALTLTKLLVFGADPATNQGKVRTISQEFEHLLGDKMDRTT